MVLFFCYSPVLVARHIDSFFLSNCQVKYRCYETFCYEAYPQSHCYDFSMNSFLRIYITLKKSNHFIISPSTILNLFTHKVIISSNPTSYTSGLSSTFKISSFNSVLRSSASINKIHSCFAEEWPSFWRQSLCTLYNYFIG